MSRQTKLPVIDPFNFNADQTIMNASSSKPDSEKLIFLDKSKQFTEPFKEDDTLVIEPKSKFDNQQIVYELDDVISTGYFYRSKNLLRIEPIDENKLRKTLILEPSIHNFKVHGLLKRIIRPIA